MDSADELQLEIARRVQAEEALAAAHEALHQIEARLRQSQKMEAVGRLAGGIAHDFNNLLTAIIGHCDLAARDAPPNGPVRDELNDIQTAAARAAALVHQLLAFSRKQELEFQSVYSEPGIGSTFKIYLPQVSAETGAILPAAPETAVPRGSETVLLVEDSDMVRQLARRVLEENGYRVIVAHDGAEALSVATEFAGTIHLVLTDVVMPGVNGRQVVERLAPARPDMKVLYMSGYTDSTVSMQRIMEAGAAFIQKPFTLTGLARRVRETLDTPSVNGS